VFPRAVVRRRQERLAEHEVDEFIASLPRRR